MSYKAASASQEFHVCAQGTTVPMICMQYDDLLKMVKDAGAFAKQAQSGEGLLATVRETLHRLEEISHQVKPQDAHSPWRCDAMMFVPLEQARKITECHSHLLGLQFEMKDNPEWAKVQTSLDGQSGIVMGLRHLLTSIPATPLAKTLQAPRLAA